MINQLGELSRLFESSSFSSGLLSPPGVPPKFLEWLASGEAISLVNYRAYSNHRLSHRVFSSPPGVPPKFLEWRGVYSNSTRTRRLINWKWFEWKKKSRFHLAFKFNLKSHIKRIFCERLHLWKCNSWRHTPHCAQCSASECWIEHFFTLKKEKKSWNEYGFMKFLN